jgi:NDP-sugar pyrophosphorylase family protein
VVPNNSVVDSVVLHNSVVPNNSVVDSVVPHNSVVDSEVLHNSVVPHNSVVDLVVLHNSVVVLPNSVVDSHPTVHSAAVLAVVLHQWACCVH